MAWRYETLNLVGFYSKKVDCFEARIISMCDCNKVELLEDGVLIDRRRSGKRQSMQQLFDVGEKMLNEQKKDQPGSHS